jgi:dienelactone hydrolase
MRLTIALLFFTMAACGHAEKKTDQKKGETVKYTVDGTEHVGYIASGAKDNEKKIGVIIVHEWWGQNEYARSRANMLADLGYVAMAVDMYGDGKTTDHPKDAGAFSKKAMGDFPLAKKRFEAAMQVLKSRPDVDPTKIVAIGYCFGGAVVLNMARAGVDMDLIASFHGSLDSKMKAKKDSYKPKTLVFNGKADSFVSDESIATFQKEMKKAEVDLTFKNYEGAKHSFTNPGSTAVGKKFDLPLEYQKEADEDSWNTFLLALSKI